MMSSTVSGVAASLLKVAAGSRRWRNWSPISQVMSPMPSGHSPDCDQPESARMASSSSMVARCMTATRASTFSLSSSSQAMLNQVFNNLYIRASLKIVISGSGARRMELPIRVSLPADRLPATEVASHPVTGYRNYCSPPYPAARA